MNLIIDLIGAAIVGSLLILMMITFQYQMHEATDRALYTMSMVDHMDLVAQKFNSVIALAGVGFNPNVAITYATQDSLVFRTYWDFQADHISTSPVTLSIKLASVPSPYGTAVVLLQDGVPLSDLGYLFWIDQLKFRYYNKTDALTTDKTLARSVEVRLSFFRSAPRLGGKPITTKLQFKCYFMNAYMRGA
jgi:hypothetical protein